MKTVLVVDDTKNIRLMLTKCLELDGWTVDTAANGREGCEKLCANDYTLAFLDIKLPELSGTEVLRKIRAQGITTPVIVITAYPTVKNAVECTQLGTVAYLQKPFTAQRLRAVLAQLELLPSPAGGAQALLDAGDFPGAIAALKRLLAENPADPVVYALLAKAHAGMGDTAAAERFRKAGEIFQ